MKFDLFLLVLSAQPYFDYSKFLWLLILELLKYLYNLNRITNIYFKSQHIVNPEWCMN